MVAEPRGLDGHFEIHVVTHAERGSLHMARGVRHEHAALAPAILAAAGQIQQHPRARAGVVRRGRRPVRVAVVCELVLQTP